MVPLRRLAPSWTVSFKRIAVGGARVGRGAFAFSVELDGLLLTESSEAEGEAEGSAGAGEEEVIDPEPVLFTSTLAGAPVLTARVRAGEELG